MNQKNRYNGENETGYINLLHEKAQKEIKFLHELYTAAAEKENNIYRISQRIKKSRSYVKNRVEELEEKGFLEVSDEGKGKQKKISITEEGKDATKLIERLVDFSEEERIKKAIYDICMANRGLFKENIKNPSGSVANELLPSKGVIKEKIFEKVKEYLTIDVSRDKFQQYFDPYYRKAVSDNTLTKLYPSMDEKDSE